MGVSRMKALKPFVADTRLEEYMKSSKWKGKIFVQDEKTCFKDGFDDGFNMAYKELELFEKENEQLKEQIKKMKRCENCKHSYHDRYHTLQCMYNCINFDKWEVAE